MPEYDNHAIASLLDDTGDLLEISGADRFRVLGYHKAAGAIRAWPHDITAMSAQDRVTEIPGVGAKTAAAVAEIIRTGTFADLEALKRQFPEGLLAVMEVSGVGPKRARQLFDKLGVDSIDALQAALASGKVAELGGFGAKSAEGIAAGVEAYLRHHDRILLSAALPLAERIVAGLAASPAVGDVLAAGSLRRMQETIGDIDILTSSDDPAAAMAAARDLPIVTRVLASGETKTSVMTTSGLQADVRVVKPGEWGAALQYFTGDKAHNVRLRELAKKAGLKLNEYGVFRIEDGERVAGATEQDVYAALGMDVPPPEIRGDHGEIEAALAHELPQLVDLGDVRGDLQTHSTATDGRSTLPANRAVAAELGYEYFAATDHALMLKMVGGLTLDDLERQWAEIDEIDATPGPRILKGIELNIDEDGGVDYDEDVLARFDFCLASMHSGWGASREAGTKRMLRVLDNPFVDIIGHPTGRVLGRRDAIDYDMDQVLAKAGETGTIFEINAYPDRLDLDDTHIRMARGHGVRFSLGTDAHEAEQFRYMPYGVAMARRGWVVAGELLNAQPWDVARTWLRRYRTLGR
jgi:DNA polymerase (family 10)